MPRRILNIDINQEKNYACLDNCSNKYCDNIDLEVLPLVYQIE